MGYVSQALKHTCPGAGGSEMVHVLNGTSSKAVPCQAMPSHTVPACPTPCCATPAGDTLASAGPVARLGAGSQPGADTRAMLAVLVGARCRPKDTWRLCLQAEERSMHESLLCARRGSPGNTTACRYRFAGLRVKGFTVFIINTINRFVVLL